MYRLADKLLEQLKKLIRREFNRLGIFGFDELNTHRVTAETVSLFERLMRENERLYLQVAKRAYDDGIVAAIAAGYDGLGENPINASWVGNLLSAYNFVSGYLYESEAERKRLRLAEQMMTAKEYQNRTLYNDSVRRSANLWWMQASHYMLEAVDNAYLQALKDSGVELVWWQTKIDGHECKVCRDRNGRVYDINKVPPKPHRGCRCNWIPVPKSE